MEQQRKAQTHITKTNQDMLIMTCCVLFYGPDSGTISADWGILDYFREVELPLLSSQLSRRPGLFRQMGKKKKN